MAGYKKQKRASDVQLEEAIAGLGLFLLSIKSLQQVSRLIQSLLGRENDKVNVLQ